MLKDVEQLQVESTLPVLSFNFDGLKTWAEGLTERYATLIVTEDAIADVKRDMAVLNKARKSVEDARKEAVRRVSEPIRVFEAQAKEIASIFDTAYAHLGAQVRAFEDAQREEKRVTVHEIIAKAVMESGYGLSIPVQEKWLNKTTSMKSIQEDVAAIIQRHIEETQRKAALEQAQKDRAVAIENHVRALNDKHGLKIPVARFLALGCNPAQPLEDTLDGINAAFTAEAEKKARLAQASKDTQSSGLPTLPAWQAPTEQKPTPVEQAAPKAEQTATPPQTRAMSIVFEYDATNESSVKACLETLKSLCVGFGARYR